MLHSSDENSSDLKLRDFINKRGKTILTYFYIALFLYRYLPHNSILTKKTKHLNHYFLYNYKKYICEKSYVLGSIYFSKKSIHFFKKLFFYFLSSSLKSYVRFIVKWWMFSRNMFSTWVISSRNISGSNFFSNFLS